MIGQPWWLLAVLLFASGAARAHDSVLAEVDKPLPAAQQFSKAGRFENALTTLRQTEAQPKRWDYEHCLLDRVRASAALAAGDDATAPHSLSATCARGRIAPAEPLQVLQTLAGTADRSKDYAATPTWVDGYFAQGGTGAQVVKLRSKTQFRQGDFAAVLRHAQPLVEAAAKTATLADEDILKLVAANYAKLANDAQCASTSESLPVSDLKNVYRADVLSRLSSLPGFADKLLLDGYRLKFATGTSQSADRFAEMDQGAVQAALPAEAKRAIEAGYASGKPGRAADAERNKPLRDNVFTLAAEDEKAPSPAAEWARLGSVPAQSR